MEQCDRVWAEIDLDAVAFNMESIKQRISSDTKIIAVIKADGYGHGAVPIAKLLEGDTCVWGYAVATAQEAMELRANGLKKPTLILAYTFPSAYEELIQNDIQLTVFTLEMASALSDAAVKAGKICKIHIKLDTGMTRIGLLPVDDSIALIRQISELENIEIEGIFTHFARADEKDRTKASAQLKQFQDFIRQLEETTGIKIPLKHCSNSAGIVWLPEANMDAVRAGIILYGLWPSADVKEGGEIALRPALCLKSRVVYVKTVPKGQEISYGGTYTTNRQSRVATVCIGYGDGYPRSLSNKGYVLINGQRAPILGRVCMDQFMVDITDIEGTVQTGTEVTLIGRDRDEEITMEDLGALSGRFNYELACDLGKRIPRVYSREQRAR